LAGGRTVGRERSWREGGSDGGAGEGGKEGGRTGGRDGEREGGRSVSRQPNSNAARLAGSQTLSQPAR